MDKRSLFENLTARLTNEGFRVNLFFADNIETHNLRTPLLICNRGERIVSMHINDDLRQGNRQYVSFEVADEDDESRDSLQEFHLPVEGGIYDNNVSELMYRIVTNVLPFD